MVNPQHAIRSRLILCWNPTSPSGSSCIGQDCLLTFRHHCATLPSRRKASRDGNAALDLSWRITLNLRPRMNRVNTLRLKLLSKKFSLSRTPLSRLNSTLRSERGFGAGNRFPATLPAQGIRKPFHPPCQSPPQRLTASPRSAIKLTRNAVSHPACCRSHLCDC